MRPGQPKHFNHRQFASIKILNPHRAGQIVTVGVHLPAESKHENEKQIHNPTRDLGAAKASNHKMRKRARE